MDHLKFKGTHLWNTAFGDDKALFTDKRNLLKSEYQKFREKVQILVGKISSVLPGLTIHDVSHLDALWETADIIAGENYPLNPLETFVFGGAVLLHDAAMCWEAYENGQVGVRNTIEWKDAYAIECDKSFESNDDERQATADFAALRYLHAHQAGELISRSWMHPDTMESIYLIDDTEIRTHLGRLIGRIASSHHWNIDSLHDLGDQFNAPRNFPTEWHIDPIKIACLLRCADAAHINQERAPDFLYALIKRQGLSQQHWQAQNRITGPALDNGDQSGSTILFTSSLPFKEDDAESWWVAHDAILLVNDEIQATNELLKQRKRINAPPFQVSKVKGARSIEELTKLLPVEGWSPCKAELHVSNIESLVRDLGGEKLYGTTHKSDIVFRELIQNSRDSIVSRRFIEQGFDGEIHIRLEEIDGNSWLYIEDNGIGMSREVMMGPLLDFGSSFWKSSLIQSEFPGLRSSKFRSVGRFGIGFYSVFMVADRVEVISKRWDKGLDDTNHLLFKTGLSLRPIYRRGRVDDFSPSNSTQVRLRLQPNIFQDDLRVSVKPPISGAIEFFPLLSDYLAAMVVGLDVKVSFSAPSSTKKLIHSGQPGINPSGEILLRQLSLSEYQTNNLVVNEYINKNHHRLRPIKSDDRILGYAAISTTPQVRRYRLCAQTIGGLLSTTYHGEKFHYIGYLDHKPSSAKRDAGSIEASPELLSEWANEQFQILINDDASDFEHCIASLNAIEFNIDPMPFARLFVTKNGIGKFVTYEELALIAEKEPVAIMKTMIDGDHADSYHFENEMDLGILLINTWWLNNKSLSLKMNAEGIPEDLFSIIGCLHRSVIANGRVLRWSKIPTRFTSMLGQMERLELVSV
ncbi:HD domain-containing protein [Methylobacter psychrophilus]|uniref:HD domain-containing protein n=1 Tax=Methylobacter psychrophilus TaxID=96941 RepID=UPI0021D4F838|nr:ATP-binding protein [Methylobacter psychrophilus]